MTNEIDEYDHYDEFDPIIYLQTFYNEIGSEGYGMLRFLHEVFSMQKPNCTVLEFGGGPTVLGMISAARIASEIHFAEYVPVNRSIVQRWVDGNSTDFDWTPYFQAVLEIEGVTEPSKHEVLERIHQLRSKITKIVIGDIYQHPPVDTNTQYDVIISNYCLDSVTGDYQEWITFLENLSSLLVAGGTIALSTLQEVAYCEYGAIRYPNVFLTQDRLRKGLIAAGFDPESIHIDNVPSDDHDERNYAGVLFASAIKL